ncbi:hypothetical protein [Deinococcus enclensis]|uniref:HTH merR-type domain-containing protein n=1 Tax=Deinococcus enclensis TaxID=1049582 RepID=A0ABT9MD03_9DEIO|nr:hypothetical protein [Deinococcus enclensis]MDP9764463.1 hypothetical protein [Deinococcus enclensis]
MGHGDPLIHAFIIFKELGVTLRDALELHSLDHSERQQLVRVLQEARTKLRDLMAEAGPEDDGDGRWFLNKSQEWAEQLASPDFKRLD